MPITGSKDWHDYSHWSGSSRGARRLLEDLEVLDQMLCTDATPNYYTLKRSTVMRKVPSRGPWHEQLVNAQKPTFSMEPFRCVLGYLVLDSLAPYKVPGLVPQHGETTDSGSERPSKDSANGLRNGRVQESLKSLACPDGRAPENPLQSRSQSPIHKSPGISRSADNPSEATWT
ncbi:hypothetical protein N657DRAFT_670509 [Parathielavia appendiculata]|uniref:Uncharacterized protein n=1 Tax=Parathielavia appendiculata TaxID=2587402 RepID=A0AAN6Z5J3_9PEZI|nr:hypothetical protein N657DRAFT_670509 [Parathielavia appendiculata]